MNKSGIIRKVDNLGRIVIPKSYRDSLKINIGDSLYINIDSHSLLLKKLENSCVFCNSQKKLFEFQGKYFCNNCCQKFLSTFFIQ